MLSRELYRSDPERVRRMLGVRHTEAPLDRLLEVDAEWRALLVQVEELKARRNAGSKEIGALFRDGRREEAEARKAEMGAIGDEISSIEERTKTLEEELTALEMSFPNLPAEAVPEGADERANREDRRWGEPPTFDFEPQAHWDLGPALAAAFASEGLPCDIGRSRAVARWAYEQGQCSGAHVSIRGKELEPLGDGWERMMVG